MSASASAFWIKEFIKQHQRRKHILLHENIHDQFLHNGNHQNIYEFLNNYFQSLNVEIIFSYDRSDGFVFLTPQMRQIFEALVNRRVADLHPDLQLNNAPPVTNTDDLISPPPRGTPGNQRTASMNTKQPPVEAFASLRAVMNQPNVSVVCILDFTDMLTSETSRFNVE